MIIRPWKDRVPQIHPTARLAKNATVIGRVTLEKNTNIWYGAVLRGDSGTIIIGENSNVQDNCVVHACDDQKTLVGKNVTVGHGAILHGCIIEEGCLIGMGCTIMDGAVIGKGSTVGAGALIPAGKIIPPGSLVVGVPGKVVRALTEEEIRINEESAAHYTDGFALQLDTYE